LSSGGHLGSRGDTGGQATDTVRDREAPGSIPGPPTKLLLLEPGIWRGKAVMYPQAAM